jgi:ATP-dependent RNA helicase DOB1
LCVPALAHHLRPFRHLLRRLNFCSKDDVIELKGRVACEISTGDELLITEMIFNGVFNDLTPQQCAALLSCFVFQEKSEEGGKLKEELAGPLRMMQDLARRIAKVSIDSKLQVDEEEYVQVRLDLHTHTHTHTHIHTLTHIHIHTLSFPYSQSFRTEMMDVVFAWSQGSKFSDICKMTDIFEGSIIRAMRRLEELLRQMCAAAKAIGNTELENKFAESISCIKRDIVFAASLYL